MAEDDQAGWHTGKGRKMNTAAELHGLLVERGPLRSVFDLNPSFRNTSLALIFDSGITCVVCDCRTDSVRIADSAHFPDLCDVVDPLFFPQLEVRVRSLEVREPGFGLTEISNERPWRDVLGWQVAWAWFLTNNLDWQDALQIQFSRASQDVTIQLIAMAAFLHAYTVHEADPS